MKVHEAVTLGAAVVFAASTTTWALATAQPDVDPAPPPTGGPPTSSSTTTTSSTSTSSTSTTTTTEAAVSATEDLVTEVEAPPVAPTPEPTSTWVPEPSATYAPVEPTWAPVVPPLDQDTPQGTIGDGGTSDPGTTPGGTTDDGATTDDGDEGAGDTPGQWDESTSPGLLDPLVPPDDGQG